MSEAVFIHEATKRFGHLAHPVWMGASKRRLHWQDHPRHKDALSNLAPVVAIDKVSFSVAPGEIFGVLGSAGSGKSTLLRLVAALLVPDDGILRVFDFDVVRQAGQVQRMVNPIKAEASIFLRLSPLENLRYAARLDGSTSAEDDHQALNLLQRLGLDENILNQPMQAVSRQVYQLVSVARALLSRPRLLLLDEPTAGLEPPFKQAVHSLLREVRQLHGTPMLLATRDPQEAQHLCDRVALLEAGRIVAIKTNPQ
jgi:ABC-2 type transport system ATP-binding protein